MDAVKIFGSKCGYLLPAVGEPARTLDVALAAGSNGFQRRARALRFGGCLHPASGLICARNLDQWANGRC